MMQRKYAKSEDLVLSDDGIKTYTPSLLTLAFRNTPEDQPVKFAHSLPIIDDAEPKLDVGYSAPMTIEGNAIQNAPTDAPDGALFHVYDMCTLPVSLQYNGLKLTKRTQNDEFNARLELLCCF